MEAGAPGCFPFLAAAFAAALAAPFVFGATDLAIPVFVAGLLVASLHILFLAAPIYLWLERRHRPTLAIILPVSALIGASPAFLVLVSGNPWPVIAETTLACALCGLAGGLAFWLTPGLAGPRRP